MLIGLVQIQIGLGHGLQQSARDLLVASKRCLVKERPCTLRALGAWADIKKPQRLHTWGFSRPPSAVLPTMGLYGVARVPVNDFGQDSCSAGSANSW